MKHSQKLNKVMHENKMKGKTLSKSEKDARTGVLGDLVDHMNDLESDKVKGLKKVTVAAKDKKSLKKGVDMVQEGLSGEGPLSGVLDQEMPEGEELAQDEESDDTPEMDVAENEAEEGEASEESELQAKDDKIAELEAKLAKLEEKLSKLA